MDKFNEINGEVLKPGDIIKYPLHSSLQTAIVINPKSGKLSACKSFTKGYRKNTIISTEHSNYNLHANNIDTHNGFIYLQWGPRDCIKVGEVQDFNPANYKSNDKLIKEFEEK